MKLLIGLVFILAIFSASAQDTLTHKKLILKLSYSSAVVKFPQLNSYVQDYFLFKSREGKIFAGGGPEIGLSFNRNKRWRIETGAHFFFADANASQSTKGNVSRSMDYKLKGFRIPVLFAHNFSTREKRVMFHSIIGIQFLHATVIRTVSEFSPTENSIEIKSSSVNEPGITAGFGLDLRLTKNIKLFYDILGALNTQAETLHGSIGFKLNIKNSSSKKP